VQHGLVRVSYTTRKAYQFQLYLKVEEANKAVAKALEWKMMQPCYYLWYNECCEAFFLKMEHQHRRINCIKTEYLEKLKEVLKSKSGNKNLPHVYPYIKKSCDPTIALLPI